MRTTHYVLHDSGPAWSRWASSGIKLILHGAHVNELPFINAGRPLSGAPEISIGQSLTVILTILTVTTVASLLKTRKDNAAIKVS